jgi:hypothetical protein
MNTIFWVGNLKGRGHLEDLDIDGKIILGKLCVGGVDWMHLAQDRDQWKPLVDVVMNLQVP